MSTITTPHGTAVRARLVVHCEYPDRRKRYATVRCTTAAAGWQAEAGVGDESDVLVRVSAGNAFAFDFALEESDAAANLATVAQLLAQLAAHLATHGARHQARLARVDSVTA